MDQQKDDVRAFFGRHAEEYRRSASHKSGADLEELLGAARPLKRDRLLDVATATGHTAFAFLPFVREVTGVDLTPEMESAFLREMAERRLTGAHFAVGDAENLPFPDGAFTIVTCRRAAHHFPNKEKALQEMVRVLEPGGRLGIVDMVPPSFPGGAELTNALEQIRDSSHVEAWTQKAWEDAVAGAGCPILHAHVAEEVIPWEKWLYPVTSTPKLDEAFLRVLDEAPRSAVHEVTVLKDGATHFRKHRIVLVAQKA